MAPGAPTHAIEQVTGATAPPHPEELLFAAELRLPGQSVLAMRFRTTPAGLISTGIMSFLMLAGLARLRRSR